MSDAADLIEITRLILSERQGRDRGWWQQMRDAFADDSTVRLSWYRGDGAGFVDGSKWMNGSGDKAVHRLSPPVIHLDADRAIAEMCCGVDFVEEVVEPQRVRVLRSGSGVAVDRGRDQFGDLNPAAEHSALRSRRGRQPSTRHRWV